MSISFTNKILGIVVLYNSKIADSNTIISINAALENADAYLDILVYDNSPECMEQHANFQYKRLNINYVHDSSNGGVSKAYNFGARYAATKPGKEWALLLDQDTSFANNLFIKYTEGYQNYPQIKLFAPILMLGNQVIFSPCKYIFGRGFPLKHITPGLSTFKNISPVNSGMLINLNAFFKAGMYNEGIRLDFSDFQFIERYKKFQSQFLIIDSVAYQDFSNNETNIEKLNARYAFFCEGAANFDKHNLLDRVKYLLVVFMRAVTLSYRTKSLMYLRTFFNSYINS